MCKTDNISSLKGSCSSTPFYFYFFGVGGIGTTKRRALPIHPSSPSPSHRNRRPCPCPSIEKAVVARSSLVTVLFCFCPCPCPTLVSWPQSLQLYGQILVDSPSTSRRAGGVSRPRPLYQWQVLFLFSSPSF
jgi:hypothetical protein